MTRGRKDHRRVGQLQPSLELILLVGALSLNLSRMVKVCFRMVTTSAKIMLVLAWTDIPHLAGKS